MEGEVQEDFQAFPMLTLINEFTTEDGIDTDALTTVQLLGALREAYFMAHLAHQEAGAALQTLAVVAGILDDRIESTLDEDGEVTEVATKPSIIIPSAPQS